MVTPPSSPLVSVLMPAYNHAPYVRDAVASVLGQTHRNLEFIVIDDASSDDTWAVLQTLRDERMRLHRHETNRGAHATLNEALGLAKGEYLAIINSDDVFFPSRLQDCLAHLEAEAADLIGTDIGLIDAEGRPVTEHWWLDAYAGLKSARQETGDWLASLAYGNMFMTTSNFFFRRSWLDAVGAFGDLRYVHDYEWLFRGLGRGCRLAWLDAVRLLYRIHGGNTISERPLAANRECAAMLRSALPEILAAGELDRQRLRQLFRQWARIEQYMDEIHSALRHEALLRKEAELVPLIEDRDGWIAERDRQLEQQARWIAERDGWIAERDGWIAERDGWIAERDGWIAERDQTIASQSRRLVERDARVAELAASIAERDAEIAGCRAAVERIESSLSFRLGRALTAPARWLLASANRR